MILSERELELSQEHEGIMLLPGDLAAGAPLADVLPVDRDRCWSSRSPPTGRTA